MFSPQIRQFLRWQRISMLLAGASLGLLSSIFSDWVANQGRMLLPWLALVAVGSSLASLVYFFRKPVGIEVAIKSPQTIRSAIEAERHARRGFIGFVPIYRPKGGSTAAGLSAEERAAALEALEFGRLRLEESNLQPTIEAILAHASRLEHCWLLATSGQKVAGSLPYARLLAIYLREEKGLRCKFHFGEPYTIALDDDALVLSKSYDQVQRILQQATRLGLNAREVVADITSGLRSMSLGMVLACLDGEQDVEFVGSRYNAEGEPVGALFPIIFSFEPALER
jgi:hypothetical protein